MAQNNRTVVNFSYCFYGPLYLRQIPSAYRYDHRLTLSGLVFYEWKVRQITRRHLVHIHKGFEIIRTLKIKCR